MKYQVIAIQYQHSLQNYISSHLMLSARAAAISAACSARSFMASCWDLFLTKSFPLFIFRRLVLWLSAIAFCTSGREGDMYPQFCGATNTHTHTHTHKLLSSSWWSSGSNRRRRLALSCWTQQTLSRLQNRHPSFSGESHSSLLSSSWFDWESCEQLLRENMLYTCALGWSPWSLFLHTTTCSCLHRFT